MHTKIVVLALFLAIATSAYAQKKIVCYYESWAKYNDGTDKYPITSIPAHHCTHVIYAFIGINEDGSIKLLDDESDFKIFSQHVKGRGSKAMVSVGGASEKSRKFSDMVATREVRETFVRHAVEFLQRHNLDGLDVDWEYPNQLGGNPADKENFVRLLKELKDAFSSHGYLLSAAVGAEEDSASRSYLIPKISKLLDFINVMTYDFNGYENGHTGMNSPLYASVRDSKDSYTRQLNIRASVQYWLDQGAPAEKIIVGVPFYGITFTLRNNNEHGAHAPTTGPGIDSGNIGYNDLCVRLKEGGWTIVWTNKQRVPYAYKGNQWVSYDNPRSIREKAEFVKSHGLGGVMIWSIDTDDFQGRCGRKNPLFHAINEILSNCKH